MNPGVTHAWLWREPERRRLVRLCAAITGDRDSAEDLAQETLLEAWRNAHKLHDPAGADRWLAAVARNVCRRWARRRGRDPAAAPLDDEPAARAEIDLEAELERRELEELLDRALGLVPAQTRDALIQRYVHDASHAEIGGRLGLSEDAVSMRLTRGKATLRRLLTAELRDEAAAYGLAGDGWRETRTWCPECGQRRLLTLREPPPGVIAFRCPGCPLGRTAAEFRQQNPFFARLLGALSRPTAVLGRTAEWSWRYFGEGAATGDARCTGCGSSVRLERYFHDRHGRASDGLFADCAGCGTQVLSSARGIALSEPHMRRFRREHPRTRSLPTRQVDHGGTAAIVVKYESVLGSAAADVVLARDTLRVLHVATG